MFARIHLVQVVFWYINWLIWFIWGSPIQDRGKQGGWQILNSMLAHILILWTHMLVLLWLEGIYRLRRCVVIRGYLPSLWILRSTDLKFVDTTSHWIWWLALVFFPGRALVLQLVVALDLIYRDNTATLSRWLDVHTFLFTHKCSLTLFFIFFVNILWLLKVIGRLFEILLRAGNVAVLHQVLRALVLFPTQFLARYLLIQDLHFGRVVNCIFNLWWRRLVIFIVLSAVNGERATSTITLLLLLLLLLFRHLAAIWVHFND